MLTSLDELEGQKYTFWFVSVPVVKKVIKKKDEYRGVSKACI